MKVAFLIMTHHQPSHLANLIEDLNCDWIHFFIHVDKKVDVTEFLRLIPRYANTTFLKNSQRIKVYWGGYSQVRATLNLLKVAQQCGEYFERFCLVSGSDFPIKKISHIKSVFDTKQEFIRIDRRLEDFDINTHYKFVRYSYFMDNPFLQRTGLSGKIPREAYNKISLYHGSTWWSLTVECVEYIMQFLKNNRDYACFHRWTLSPDEIFFHSIVKSSPFASNISHDFEKSSSNAEYFQLNEHGCTYINWNVKNVPLPKVLVLEDYNDLVNSSCLLARKFDQQKSLDLVKIFQKQNLPDI